MTERSRSGWRELVAHPVRHEAYNTKRNECKGEKETIAGYMTFARGFPWYHGYPNTEQYFTSRMDGDDCDDDDDKDLLPTTWECSVVSAIVAESDEILQRPELEEDMSVDKSMLNC